VPLTGTVIGRALFAHLLGRRLVSSGLVNSRLVKTAVINTVLTSTARVTAALVNTALVTTAVRRCGVRNLRLALKLAPVLGNPAFGPHRDRNVGHTTRREDGRVVQVHDHSEYGSHAHGGNARHYVQPPESQHE
jgi:hypothetical protein